MRNLAMPLTEETLQAIEARAEAASPPGSPPWQECYFDAWATDADYDFIRYAVIDVQRLLAETRHLRAKLEHIKEVAEDNQVRDEYLSPSYILEMLRAP